jgi:hypothetical protein
VVADERRQWWLENAEQRSADQPNSFFIPAREKRHSLQSGDVVKLLFAAPSQAGDLTVERMWVEVNSVGSGSYVGTLSDRPDHITSLAEGDVVEFGPEHVAAFNWSPEELSYDPGLFAWTRSVSSHPGGVRPAQVALRPTDADAVEGDSGWLLGDGRESPTEFSDPEVFGWTALGWLTDLYPELEPVFRSGEGTWQWHDEDGTYHRVG